jgi:4-hydroxybenzoate polyprenyltransferase
MGFAAAWGYGWIVLPPMDLVDQVRVVLHQHWLNIAPSILPALILYASGVVWTLGYDTIYALQDLEDDALAGVKSSARKLGSKAPLAVSGFYGVTALMAAAMGALAGLGPLFWVGLAVFAAHLGWQAHSARIDNPALALKLFKSNVTAGAILFVAIVAGALPVAR